MESLPSNRTEGLLSWKLVAVLVLGLIGSIIAMVFSFPNHTVMVIFGLCMMGCALGICSILMDWHDAKRKARDLPTTETVRD